MRTAGLLALPAVVLMLALTGCQAPPAQAELEQSGDVSYLVSPAGVFPSGSDAAMAGTLVADPGGCVALVQDDRHLGVVWPAGTRVEGGEVALTTGVSLPLDEEMAADAPWLHGEIVDGVEGTPEVCAFRQYFVVALPEG
ncbi:hypothetical protein [Agrococcus baldri]|uniref:Lipoprotein n=1 Tax=Agrococcus baldri TaxID=153730 RepID=A0AA87UXF3_9MICO|nr:hypothetical protein [Agrococcus baldri]GEK80357.1 hypothetical protein ABA31_17080 [Agrococcus baldri]